MDENERYGVVLTDNKRARLFTAQMGELTEHEDLLSETSQRTRGVGPDQWRAQKRHDARHQEEVALHAKRVIDALHDLSLRAPFDRLIVAGPPQATGQLVRLLPKRLSGKLVETVSMRVSADRKEVLNKILAVQRRMEREQESKLVEGLVAELHDAGKAVAEFASVLDAVNQGRVWKLFYARACARRAGSAKSAAPTCRTRSALRLLRRRGPAPGPGHRPAVPDGDGDGRAGRGRRWPGSGAAEAAWVDRGAAEVLGAGPARTSGRVIAAPSPCPYPFPSPTGASRPCGGLHRARARRRRRAGWEP